MAILPGYRYRFPVTVVNTNIDDNLTNYPVLIRVGGAVGQSGEDLSAIFTELGSNSKKLAVTTSDGVTQCFVDIARWNDTLGSGELWAKVPTVSSGEDTSLYLYYDNTVVDNTAYVDVTGTGAAETVWSGYQGIWHLEETGAGVSGEYIDGTTNDNDGRSKTDTFPILDEGLVGNRQDFNDNSAIVIDDDVSLDFNTAVLSVQTVLKADITTGTNALVGKYNHIGVEREWTISRVEQQIHFIFGDPADGTFEAWEETDSNVINNTTDNYHVSGTYEGATNTILIYVDGSLEASTTIGSTVPASIYQGSSDLAFSGYSTGSPGGLLNGRLDEIRLFEGVLTAEWIKADYYNWEDNFIDFGAVEDNYTIVPADPLTGVSFLDGVVPIVQSEPLIGIGALSGTPFYSIPVIAEPLTIVSSLSVNKVVALFSSVLNLINSLNLGSNLRLVNSLNITITEQLTLINDILRSLSGTQTFKFDIDQLQKIEDQMTLINHLLASTGEGSGVIILNDFYFSKPLGIT